MQSTQRFSFSDPLRWVLTLWIILGVAISVRTILRPTSHTVFPVFATGAQHWWGDQSLYAAYPPLDLFRYPPVLAVAITPMYLLGPCLGGILWSWLSLLVYGWGLWQLGRAVIPQLSSGWNTTGAARWQWSLLLAVGLLGAARGLWNAQSNALSVGLLLLGAAALIQEKWWRGAFWLAGATAVKLTPIAPVLLLCAVFPRRLLGRLVVALLVFALFPFLTRPLDTVWMQYHGWFHQLVGSTSMRWPGFRDAWTIWLVVRHLYDGGTFNLIAPIDTPWYRVIQLAGAGLALLWSLWLRWRGVPQPRLVQATLAAGCAWLLLLGPAVEHATFAFLAPPLALALAERSTPSLGRWFLLYPAALLVLILGFGALTRPWQVEAPWLYTPLPVGTALFSVWLVTQRWGVRSPSVVADEMPAESQQSDLSEQPCLVGR